MRKHLQRVLVSIGMHLHFRSRIAHNGSHNNGWLEWGDYMKCVEYDDEIMWQPLFLNWPRHANAANGKLESYDFEALI